MTLRQYMSVTSFFELGVTVVIVVGVATVACLVIDLMWQSFTRWWDAR